MKLTHNLLVLVLAMNCCALFAGEQHRNQGVQKPETIAAMHSMMPQKQEPMEAQNPKKRELITAFAADIAFISRIIAEGEKDDKERTAFSGIFAQQLRWFEDTLRSSNGPEDDAWKAALAKKLLIKTIVKHQEEADAFLDTVAKRQGVDDAMQKSVRLAVLYALNTRLQGKVQKTIDAQEIEQLVMESVAKVTKKPEMAQGASVQQSAKSVQVCEPLLIEPIAQTKMAPMVNPLALELKNANESLELLKQKSLL